MELKKYSFQELLSRIVDNRGKTCPTAEEGTALIATNCIRNDELYPVFEKIRWVDQVTMENWFRGHPEPGDIERILKANRISFTRESKSHPAYWWKHQGRFVIEYPGSKGELIALVSSGLKNAGKKN